MPVGTGIEIRHSLGFLVFMEKKKNVDAVFSQHSRDRGTGR